MRKQIYSYTLTTTTQEKLQELSQQTNISMSRLVEQAIEKLVKEMNDNE